MQQQIQSGELTLPQRPDTSGQLNNDLPPQPIILRQSIYYLILKLITVEILFDSIYLLVRVPPVYLHFPLQLDRILLPIYFFSFVALTSIKLILIVTLALRWISMNYKIGSGEIRFKSGIFSRKEKVFLCTHAQEVSCSQGFFERICNFGTIEVHNPTIKERILLHNVQNPTKYAEIIKNNISKANEIYINAQ